MKPVLADHSVSELIASCNSGWIEYEFFHRYEIFKSSAKRVEYIGNSTVSHMSFTAIRNSVTEIEESWRHCCVRYSICQYVVLSVQYAWAPGCIICFRYIYSN